MTTYSRLCLLVLTLFFSLAQAGWASWQYSGNTPDGDFSYIATYYQTAGGAYEGTASIVSFTGTPDPNGHVTIPETIQFTATQSNQSVNVTCSVTAIQQSSGQPGAFAGKLEIKTVSLPSTLLYIGTSSFEGCTGLENLSIPPSVTYIGSYAFVNCTGLGSVNALGSLTIPGSVTGIGDYAFANCTGLENLTLDEGVSTIGMFAFGNCSGLVSAHIPSSVTFMGHNTGNFSPRGVFEGCSSLTGVTIAKGADIGAAAFYRCAALTQINFVGSLNPSNPGSIGSLAFQECTLLDNVFLPEGITQIGTAAFTGCSNLQTLVVPSSLVSWDGAFIGCPKLENVTLANGLPSIANYAFSQCPKLEIISLRPSITSIGEGAFRLCSKITTINNTGNLTAIGIRAFEGCESLKSPIFPPNVTSIEYITYAGCTEMEDFVFPPSITRIGSGAFTNCTNLTAVTIPSTVTEIGEFPFNGCEKITEAHFPPNATSIGSTFGGCAGLVEITIPSGVTTIGESAFAFCWELSNVTIPSGVTSIGVTAFLHCRKLTSITIPAGVQTVSNAAFLGCWTLNSAYFLGPAPTIGSRCFESSPTTIYYLPTAAGFTSPTWQGYPAFPMVPYGGMVPDLESHEAHLFGGAPTDGYVTLVSPLTVTSALVQRQTAPVTLDLGQTNRLRLSLTETVLVETGYGALTIGTNPGDGFLTAGGNANSPGSLVLDNASINDLTVNAVIANNGSGGVKLTKNGSGKAILNASNSYSGETSINSGTLVLKSTRLADASAVRVSNNSTLNLDYTGTDLVSALYLGGTLQPNGLYDSTNTGGLITGTGKVQIGPFASYSAWTDVNAPGQTTDQDHDHDGVANGIEYFMGKTGNDFTGNPALAADGTVTWPKSPAFNGSYAVQTSTDLSVWTDVTDDPIQVTTNSGSVVWARPTSPGKCFVRLLVTPN